MEFYYYYCIKAEYQLSNRREHSRERVKEREQNYAGNTIAEINKGGAMPAYI